MSPSQLDDLFPYMEEKNIDIYAEPQFADKEVTYTSARFKGESYHYIEGLQDSMGMKTGYISADGKIILKLNRILGKKKRTNKVKSKK